jgi:hypothetical protein
MVIMRMAEAIRVVIHTPRWFMLGNKDIQTCQKIFVILVDQA